MNVRIFKNSKFEIIQKKQKIIFLFVFCDFVLIMICFKCWHFGILKILKFRNFDLLNFLKFKCSKILYFKLLKCYIFCFYILKCLNFEICWNVVVRNFEVFSQRAIGYSDKEGSNTFWSRMCLNSCVCAFLRTCLLVLFWLFWSGSLRFSRNGLLAIVIGET